jgi:hypothetical protein
MIQQIFLPFYLGLGGRFVVVVQFCNMLHLLSFLMRYLLLGWDLAVSLCLGSMLR